MKLSILYRGPLSSCNYGCDYCLFAKHHESDQENYYDDEALHFFEAIDPLFPINNQRHASMNRACRTGESVFSVDGGDTMRRCHFIRTPIGNIYDAIGATLCARDFALKKRAAVTSATFTSAN